MSSTITTITFLILTLVTVFLGLMMSLDRAKFVRTLKGQTGFFSNLTRSGPDEFLTMIQIYLPIKLDAAPDEKTKRLRDAAVKSTRYAMISTLITVIVPVILFKILDWAGI